MAFEALCDAAFGVISFCDLKIVARYDAFADHTIRMFRAVCLDD
jgi:hypothetical protein